MPRFPSAPATRRAFPPALTHSGLHAAALLVLLVLLAELGLAADYPPGTCASSSVSSPDDTHRSPREMGLRLRRNWEAWPIPERAKAGRVNLAMQMARGPRKGRQHRMTTRAYAASSRPLRVVSVSLGSSKRNHEVEVEMLRVGTQVAVIALALWLIHSGPGHSDTGDAPPTPAES